MVTIKSWLKLVNYRITEGYEFYMKEPAQTLYTYESYNGKQTDYSTSVVFKPSNNIETESTVYFMEVCDYKNNRAYRYVNPEVKHIELDPVAWDNVNWVDLLSENDFFKKATAIITGEDYDTRICMPIMVPIDTFIDLCSTAHSKDVTLNNLVNTIVKESIEL